MEMDSFIGEQFDSIFKEYLSKVAHRPRHILLAGFCLLIGMKMEKEHERSSIQ